MKAETRQFLNFNEQNINVLSKDGTTWVAIKPICTALNVDYISQFKNLQQNEILSGVLSKQTIHDTTDRLQEMVCLPEKYIYGWLFSINSKSYELQQYKKECYDVLYDYFQGATTQRLSLLQQKSADEKLLAELQEQLKGEIRDSPTYQKLRDVKA